MLDTSSNPLLALILWSDTVQPSPRMALSILVPLLLPCPGSTLLHQAPQRPGAWRRSLALSAHEQLLRKELPRNQTQSLLSSQTLQVPEKQRKMRASHRQPASGKGTLSRIFQREATCPKK